MYSFPHRTASWKELAIARSSEGWDCVSPFTFVADGWTDVWEAVSGMGELAREVRVDSRRAFDFEGLVVEWYE